MGGCKATGRDLPLEGWEDPKPEGKEGVSQNICLPPGPQAVFIGAAVALCPVPAVALSRFGTEVAGCLLSETWNRFSIPNSDLGQHRLPNWLLRGYH